jgi:hypothetical protein
MEKESQKKLDQYQKRISAIQEEYEIWIKDE